MRLAAIGMGAHPHPDRFVMEELVTEDSAVTGYLVHEVLNTQPPEVREILLSTSILDRVSVEAASELTGHEQAGTILAGAARPGGLDPRIGAEGRDRLRRAGRPSRLPGAAGAGGGFARPIRPRGYIGRPDDRGAPAGQRPPPVLPPAALVALACVHLAHYEMREARSWLKQADAALSGAPDKLIEAVAYLAAAYGSLAKGRAAVAAQIIARARSGWFVPAWLDHRLSQAESRAYAAAADIPAALAAAERADRDTAPETAVTLACAWAAAGDTENAMSALIPVLATDSGAPEPVRLQAWLVDARLGYNRDDRTRGRRSLATALRLAEPEQLRLPFVIERGWILPALRRDPVLAHAHQHLLAPIRHHNQLPAPPGAPDQALAAGPLSQREQEVLRHVSRLLSTAEIASEMHISINTVKTHLAHINRKLATTRRAQAVRRGRQLELI